MRRKHRSIGAMFAVVAALVATTVLGVTGPGHGAAGAIGLDASPGSGAVAIDALTWPTD